jgi:hypothetical protein
MSLEIVLRLAEVGGTLPVAYAIFREFGAARKANEAELAFRLYENWEALSRVRKKLARGKHLEEFEKVRLANFFEQVGFAAKKKYMKIGDVDEQLGGSVLYFWNLLEKGYRGLEEKAR